MFRNVGRTHLGLLISKFKVPMSQLVLSHWHKIEIHSLTQVEGGREGGRERRSEEKPGHRERSAEGGCGDPHFGFLPNPNADQERMLMQTPDQSLSSPFPVRDTC